MRCPAGVDLCDADGKPGGDIYGPSTCVVHDNWRKHHVDGSLCEHRKRTRIRRSTKRRSARCPDCHAAVEEGDLHDERCPTMLLPNKGHRVNARRLNEDRRKL